MEIKDSTYVLSWQAIVHWCDGSHVEGLPWDCVLPVEYIILVAGGDTQVFVWIKPYAARIQRNEDKLFPVYLLAVCVLAYALLIPLLGFYWDDWPMLWFLHALGPGGFDQVWAMDRPLVGVLFQLSTAMIGAVPWGWHVFALAARWTSLMAFWWGLRELWPDRKQAVRWVILLLAVYPGFQQQSIGLIYSHYFLVMAFVGVSWASMLSALHRTRAWMWFALSIICGAVGLFSMEFFLGSGIDPTFCALDWIETIPKRTSTDIHSHTISRAFCIALDFLSRLANENYRFPCV